MKMTTIIIIAVVLLIAVPFLMKAQSAASGAYQNIDVTEFTKMMKGNNVVVLDVRTPQETTQGKIKGAKEINVFDPNFNQKIAALDKGKTYLVYCRSGNRSARACSLMAKQGFENLFNLQGGYTAWTNR
ncbi:MAG TPA: rhodanese-like domain-containing protein [Saprospiraceae bacterium]|nr:rhodanese-like domain-containing protein [Saprospiraceae bacterium]HMQ83256.1 rhodanese-like domain-containing protein [Saprospiraceae bacterium]